MPMQSAKRIVLAALPLALLILAGCASDRSNPFAAEPAAAPKPAAPAINMAGRWMLQAPGGAACGMTFTAAPGATSGKVAPEGGCPGNFFTSRQWAFDQGALVIYDHKDQALARLAAAESSDRFDGTAVSGLVVRLSR